MHVKLSGQAVDEGKQVQREQERHWQRRLRSLAWCVLPVIEPGSPVLSECYWLHPVLLPRYASGLFKGIKIYF